MSTALALPGRAFPVSTVLRAESLAERVSELQPNSVRAKKETEAYCPALPRFSLLAQPPEQSRGVLPLRRARQTVPGSISHFHSLLRPLQSDRLLAATFHHRPHLVTPTLPPTLSSSLYSPSSFTSSTQSSLGRPATPLPTHPALSLTASPSPVIAIIVVIVSRLSTSRYSCIPLCLRTIGSPIASQRCDYLCRTALSLPPAKSVASHPLSSCIDIARERATERGRCSCLDPFGR